MGRPNWTGLRLAVVLALSGCLKPMTGVGSTAPASPVAGREVQDAAQAVAPLVSDSGNLASAGTLCGIAFGPGGVLLGKSNSWQRSGSAALAAIPPGGLATGDPGCDVPNWPNWISY